MKLISLGIEDLMGDCISNVGPTDETLGCWELENERLSGNAG